MLSKEITAKLNTQLNRELYASYLYLSMAAWLESKSWNGFALWMENQSTEERAHAMKIYHYILEQGEQVTLQTVDAPPASFSSVIETFEKTLQAEQEVSESYRLLMGDVKAVNDSATEIFLQWYITEQIEEEATVSSILDRLKRVEKSPEAMLLMDKEVETLAKAGPE